METDPSTLSIAAIYRTMVRLITPRPIAWVSTQSIDGRLNLAPFSYFAGVASSPPTLMISVVDHSDGRPKDTTRNIRETGEFVVNVVPASLAAGMHRTGAELDYGESEFSSAGVEPVPSRLVGPPGVSGVPARMECRLSRIYRIGTGSMASNAIFGRIVWIHEDDLTPANDSGHDTIARMGAKSYCRTRDRFEM
jgi:flavin reductase (DIM6/NTAB) family NADH-FMN oxidoreductase RutF